MNDRIACPKCSLADKIEKVSAIISHQTRTRRETDLRTETYTDLQGQSHSSIYSVPYDVVEATDLAKHLNMPPRPQVGSDQRGCLALITLVLIFALLTGVPVLINATLGMGGNLLTVLAVSAVPTLGGGFLILFLIILYLGASVSHKQDVSRVKGETLRWEHAVIKWEQTYYCYRDDIIFIPGKDGWAASSQALRFFFSGLPFTVSQEPPKKSNTSTIIIITSIVLFSCVCIGLTFLWQYGDALMNSF